mgnify:CR=1 FL=1
MSIIEKKILKGLKLTNYNFKKPPLVVGGLAMEYYNIRKTGHDFDFVVSPVDWKDLKKMYPDKINLFGGQNEKDIDATINLDKVHVDLISTLFQFNYNYLSKGAIKNKDYKIIAIDKLLMLKTLGAVFNNHIKSIKDQQKIVDNIVKINYSLARGLEKFLKRESKRKSKRKSKKKSKRESKTRKKS